MIRILLACGLALGLLLSGQLFAAQPPQELVRTTAEKMLEKLRSERELLDKNPRRIYDLVDEIVLPHFDFERMSRWVLGKYWRDATPEQKQRFIEEFRNLLVRTYAKSLSEYKDNKINYPAFRADPKDEEVTVHTEVEQPGAFPIPIDYRLVLKNDEWKVFDVTIDGVSLVANYRNTFANEIRQGGLDKLINSLAERNQRADKGG